MRRSIVSWFLFTVLVTIPTVAITVGVLQASTSDRYQRLQTYESRRVEASRLLRRDIELARLRSEETLRNMEEGQPAADLEATLRAGRSVYVEPYVIAPNGAVVLPPDDHPAHAAVAEMLAATGVHVRPPTVINIKLDPPRPGSDGLTDEQRNQVLRANPVRDMLRQAGLPANVVPRTAPLTLTRPCPASFGRRCVVVVRHYSDGTDRGYVLAEEWLVRGASTVIPPEMTLVRAPESEDEAEVYAIEDPTRHKLSIALPKPLNEDIVISSTSDTYRVVYRQPGLLWHDVVHHQHVFRAWFLVPLGTMVLVAFVLFGQKRRAQDLANLRTDYVAAVSHELRTPLASVRMLAELLEAGAVPVGERVEVEHTLARETRRLGATLERMLRFGALARGKLVVAKQRTLLGPLLADAVKRFYAAHPGREVVVEVDPGLEIDVDPGLFGLAIDNLLGNAAKYAPDGGPYRLAGRRASATVLRGGPYRMIGREGGGGAVSVSVEDHGPGLDRKTRARIFLPFERADDRLSRATEGTGVGLTLVRGIARAHGGDAAVTSEPGAGATFVATFPEA